jgi:CubicO group peptidase (beta-lactamase class C family)
MAALGSLPLMYQPGERWLYNSSAQVLGVLLARATGKDVETVMRERIFEPSPCPTPASPCRQIG